jgi:arylsulfatase A
MKKHLVLLLFLFTQVLCSCASESTEDRPNIILIMADDMGYESLSTNGAISYHTPNLDRLASDGIRFSKAISQPLCTPSRVKIMTGFYNYRNYDYFANLNTNQYTFGNLMQEAGYATCIAGKWQLNGQSHKDKIPNWEDNAKPIKFGFDEYCLWQLTKRGSRYANPLIEQNGAFLESKTTDYGPELFANYILDFIERKKEQPFFIYYPMVLVHDRFVPTPDSKDWTNTELRTKNDTTYFKDMVAYTDKIVGRIHAKLQELNLDKNTILIFTGDNGTHPSVYSDTKKGRVRGAKGNTIDTGTHVPLVISWPEKITKGMVYNELIELSDFFPTFADIVEKETISDGQSFYPLLKGEAHNPRETSFVHYDPQWGKLVNQYRNQFVRTTEYKLYQDGKFFNLAKDKLEETPLLSDVLTEEELHIKQMLANELKKHPAWDKQQ